MGIVRNHSSSTENLIRMHRPTLICLLVVFAVMCLSQALPHSRKHHVAKKHQEKRRHMVAVDGDDDNDGKNDTKRHHMTDVDGDENDADKNDTKRHHMTPPASPDAEEDVGSGAAGDDTGSSGEEEAQPEQSKKTEVDDTGSSGDEDEKPEQSKKTEVKKAK